MRAGSILVAAAAGLAGPAAAPAHAEPRPTTFHAEVDPLTIANSGYGGQVGIRLPVGLRLAAASFALDVPELAATLNGNDGFEVRVRPSAAIYALYYLGPPGHDGFAFGGSLRYLRLRYTFVDAPGEAAETSELSPELIAAYQWHPNPRYGFYLQPWIGLSLTAYRDGEPVVGGHRYRPLPVQPFFTINVGWELGARGLGKQTPPVP